MNEIFLTVRSAIFLRIMFSPGFSHVFFNRKYGVGLRISSRGISWALFTLGYRDGCFWIDDGRLRVEDCFPFVAVANVYARCPIPSAKLALLAAHQFLAAQ
jgi:hypothetical protein